MLVTALPSHAQSWLDYDQVLSRYPLLRTSNAATLTSYTPGDSTQRLLGDARLSISTAHGHLERHNAAPHAWQAQAQVRSIYRMNPRVVLRGMMDYSYGCGSRAGGSVWIHPERMPFDITETADSTRGDISLETYHLNGEAGIDIGQGISLGARFDYSTASGAKRKDPRHTSVLMNCDISVGAAWQHSGLTIGANYLFGRNTEAVKFSTVGRTDQLYHYLIDYGALFGRDETTDGNGYVGSSNERPLLDLKHGVALQAAYQFGATSWGVEGRCQHRHGHYGLESPSMIDFNRHNGDEWTVQAWWQNISPCAQQRVSLSWNHQSLSDKERTYRIITNQGVTDVNYYDDRLMGQRSSHALGISGDARWGIHRELATWQVRADVNHYRHSVTASVYPYYRQQQAYLTQVTLHGVRNWLTERDHVWSLQLQAGWAGGGGTAAHDGTYEAVNADSGTPAEHALYMMRQYEYLTANRLLAGMSVGWSMPVMHHHMRLYAEGSYRYCQAHDIHYLENGYRHHAALSVGCLF